ncbi:histidine kinase, partial [Streptomonospora salina]
MSVIGARGDRGSGAVRYCGCDGGREMSGEKRSTGGGSRPRRSDTGAAASGPALVGGAVLDALWRTPGSRPGGALRLFHGPRRPTEGRIVAGVCVGLARGSQPMAIALRVVFPLILPMGFLVYLLLWMVLPSAADAPDGLDPSADPEDGGPLPPVQPREVTAWFLLLGIGGGVAALVAVQLVQFHHVAVLPSVLLGLVIGLPCALLPSAPLLTWRIVAAGLVAVLVAVAAADSTASAPGGAPGTAPQLWPWPVAALVALPVVLYVVAVTYPGRIALGVGVVTVAADIAAAFPVVGTHPGQAVWISVLAAAVLLFGYNVRSRRAAQRRLAQESALRRRDRARQEVLEERSRIARELHDVVSHHMSMIAVQADAAAYKFPDLDPGPAAAFTTIRDASRDALAEMRRVVGLLREEDEAPEA